MKPILLVDGPNDYFMLKVLPHNRRGSLGEVVRITKDKGAYQLQSSSTAVARLTSLELLPITLLSEDVALDFLALVTLVFIYTFVLRATIHSTSPCILRQ